MGSGGEVRGEQSVKENGGKGWRKEGEVMRGKGRKGEEGKG